MLYKMGQTPTRDALRVAFRDLNANVPLYHMPCNRDTSLDLWTDRLYRQCA